jgi:hypothetical protein
MFLDKIYSELGRAEAQAVSHRPHTAEAIVGARLSPCGNCELSDNGTGFSPRSSVFPCQYHFTIAIHAHIHHLENEK